MSLEELQAALPESARKHLDPGSPLPMRMMAAKGMAPLPPADTVIVLCGLSLPGDEKIAATAQATLQALPDKILGPVLSGELPAAAFLVLAPLLVGQSAKLQLLVLNRRAPDHALAAVASAADAEVAEIIANNQERCLRSETLVRAVAQNPHILRSSLDRLFDFLVRAGVIHEGMPEFGEAMARLSPGEMQEAAAHIALPSEVLEELVREEAAPPSAESEATPVEAPATAPSEEESKAEPAARVPVLKMIAGLTVAQKVALALRGNREARSILVRDANRVVAAAAIRSPRVTEQEVLGAAQSRAVSDEVIRIIATSKDLLRSYSVKVALVNNPKTPLPVAMKLMPLLRHNDVKALAKSKNVTAAVTNQAKRLLATKTSG